MGSEDEVVCEKKRDTSVSCAGWRGRRGRVKLGNGVAGEDGENVRGEVRDEVVYDDFYLCWQFAGR